MRRSAVLVLLVLCWPMLAMADPRERLASCAEVMREVLNIPEGIPADLLDKAECVVVIPSVKKLALGFGGSYGRGAMVCRSGEAFDGPWGPPSMMRLEGGSFGLQIGGAATDYILLVMNPKGVDSLLRSKAKLGADASVSAGPKGRTAAAATDLAFNAEVLSYSRSKGLFAGISLEGSTLRPDHGANDDLYGVELRPRAIVREGTLPVPEAALPLVDTLQDASPENHSN